MPDAPAPAGTCRAELGGSERPLKITLGEIERFEDAVPGGFYDFFARLMDSDGGRPRLREIRLLLHLALVGGGLSESEATEVMRREGPDRMLHHVGVARDVMVVTLIPNPEDRDLLAKSGDGAGPKGQADSGSGA